MAQFVLFFEKFGTFNKSWGKIEKLKKIKIGVLGTAKIAREQVIPAIQNSQNCELTAIGSRELEKARATAQNLGIKKYYASYQQLLDDPEIDAIYNPLPNHLHVPWTIKALKSGKHVLCEKPIGMSAIEVKKLLSESDKFPSLKIMEGFMYKHHPQWKKAINIIQSGKLGVLKSVQSYFSYLMDDPGNIRNRVEFGGGGLLDIGCYSVSLSRLITGQEPERVFGNWRLSRELKTDIFFTGIIEFRDVISTFTCATNVIPHQRVEITGSEASLELTSPFNPSVQEPIILKLTRGNSTENFKIPVCNQFTMMSDNFANCIINDVPVPYSLKDSYCNMLVLDALKKSAETNATVLMETFGEAVNMA